MKRPAVMFVRLARLPERLNARTECTGPWKAPAIDGCVLLAWLAAIFVLVSLGCVTPLPRPDRTAAASPTPVVTEIPAAIATLTLAPGASFSPGPTAERMPTLAPSATPDPRLVATPAPTSAPTKSPGPGDPTNTPGPSHTPVPTEDFGGLMLQVYAPEDGAVVPGSGVAVYGQTSPGARVFIGGEETGVDAQGGFRAEVSLVPEENDVVVVSLDEAGRRRSVSRTVTSLALPFLLLITEPENESIVSASLLRLSGRTGPNAIVSINGRSSPVDRFGYFSSTVALDEGPNVIDVVATNDDGRTLSTVLAVIYRAPGE